MARPKNAFPTLRWCKSIGQWVVYLARKRVRLGADKAGATARYKALLASTPNEPIPSAGSLSLAEALLQFRRHAGTYHTDRRTLRRIDRAIAAANAIHASTPANLFRARALRDVRDSLLAIEPPLSRRYINHLIQALQSAFTWLVAEELVEPDVLTALRAVRALGAGRGGRETLPVAPVAPEVVDAVVRECRPTLAAMLRVQQLAGMRPGELIRMRRDELSVSMDEQITVPGLARKVSATSVGGVTIWLYAPGRHKNAHRGKVRVIPLGPAAQAALEPLLAGIGDGGHVFRPAADIADMPANPMIKPGECYTLSAYANAIKRAVRRARKRGAAEEGVLLVDRLIPYFAPNQLRHAAAESTANQIDAESAGAMLGHAASRRSLDAYVQASIQKAAEAAAKVG